MGLTIGLAISNVMLGDDNAAQVAADRLLADFSDNEDIAEAVNEIAHHYRVSQKCEKAKQLYQHVVDNWPGAQNAIWAQMGLAISNIALGDDPNAQAAIDSLIADFNDHSALPEAVFQIGEQYYKKARSTKSDSNLSEVEVQDYYQKAIAIWERIIRELPYSTAYAPRAYYLIAHCCFEYLREYEKAIQSCQKLLINWPDYEYAWHAQFLIGNYYERLTQAGRIPESGANPIIEQAYQAVVEKYPDCSKFKYASLRLAELNFEREQWTEAAMYYELFLTKFPDSNRPSSILYPLGQAYDNMGEVDEAIRVYNEFLKRAYPGDPRIESVRRRIEELTTPVAKARILSDIELSTIYGGCDQYCTNNGTACEKEGGMSGFGWPICKACEHTACAAENAYACFVGYCLICTSTSPSCSGTYWMRCTNSRWLLGCNWGDWIQMLCGGTRPDCEETWL